MACCTLSITHSRGVAVARWTTRVRLRSGALREHALDDARDGRDLRDTPYAGHVPGSQWEDAMTAALDEARAALATGDVPIGAVVLDPDGEVVATGRNIREAEHDPTGHAEVVALRAAAA